MKTTTRRIFAAVGGQALHSQRALVYLASLALLVDWATPSWASPIQATYSTVGTIGTTGITGTPDVSFQGVSNATLTAGQPFDLGQFVVTTPPGGGTTTYGTPFQITLTVTNASGDPALANATPINIKGYLESELIGGKWTTVAGFNFTGTPRVGAPPQEALSYWISEGGHIAYQLYPTSSLNHLSPTSQNGGVFGVQAELDAKNVPEPTALALLLGAGVVVFVKRCASRARARRPAP